MKAKLRSGRHAAPVVVPYLQLDPLFAIRGLRISVAESHVVKATVMASLNPDTTDFGVQGPVFTQQTALLV